MESTLIGWFWRARRLLLVPLAAIAVAACSESIGPGGPGAQPGELDAVTANQEAQDIFTTISTNPALESMDLLETAAPLPVATALVQATRPFDPGATSGGGLAARMRNLAVAAPYFSAANPAVILPADLLGKVMVYDATTQQYVVDPDQSVDPDRVRFILYAIDPVFKNPIVDSPVGYAEFIDESTPAANVLHIVVVVNDVTVIDYTATASVNVLDGGSVTFGARGTITNGNKGLTFNLSQTLSETNGVSFDYMLEATEGDASVHFVASAAPEQPVHIVLTVSNGVDQAVLDVMVSDREISGTVDLPEPHEDIIISGNPEEPTFAHENPESPLTDRDEVALRDLFRTVDRLSEVVNKLLRPAHRILNFPILEL